MPETPHYRCPICGGTVPADEVEQRFWMRGETNATEDQGLATTRPQIYCMADGAELQRIGSPLLGATRR